MEISEDLQEVSRIQMARTIAIEPVSRKFELPHQIEKAPKQVNEFCRNFVCMNEIKTNFMT